MVQARLDVANLTTYLGADRVLNAMFGGSGMDKQKL